jgi:diguanylate cyclase (GGDEF)-like protein
MDNPLSIVVVDDAPSSVELINTTLSRSGYADIRISSDPRNVMPMLNERHADIVLIDWIMPELDGLALAERIRQLDEETNHYTAIIIITARAGIEHLVNAFENGVDDYLNKPLDSMELTARVRAAGRIAILQNSLLQTTETLSQSNSELAAMATTDPLTGLGNRRYLRDHLEPLMNQVRNRNGALCCGMIDIDHFKQINDTYGHQVGDEILVGVSRRLKRTVRPTDIVTRIGGEEFAIVMQYNQTDLCNPEHFHRVLESIRQRAFKTSAGNIKVTISIGLFRYSHGDTDISLNDILLKADEKLYVAKNEGRDRVAC